MTIRAKAETAALRFKVDYCSGHYYIQEKHLHPIELLHGRGHPINRYAIKDFMKTELSVVILASDGISLSWHMNRLLKATAVSLV
jgi:hypothetical protein